ncbi:MAG: hypothetical protein Q8P68_05060 [Candidatus Peregrinibacteria bacterium]|nr:hypothetical protein [Candidatus Peregrinibacteria bacterium]MDZ4244479.1 hypothetical protein [Candidatus Gracilibacteria bacterium]
MSDGQQNQGWVTGNVINLQGIGGDGNSASAGNSGSAGQGAGATDPVVAKRAQFQIPADMQQKYPALVDLVVMTESMTDDERQYWFQIMPVMTEQQLLKFQGILETEKKQLQKLDQEYDDQLKKLNSRHLIEWQEFETREKRKEIETAEKQSEVQEKKAEEDLLQQLDDV